MKVLFIQDNGINESLLLTELSAYLRQRGHHTAVALEREEKNLEEAVERENPDLLFIPASVLAHHWVLRTAGNLRRSFPDLPQVLAGSHPTFYPDILNFDEVEMILVGEVEEATAELLEALAGGRPRESVKNLHFKKGKTIHRNELRPLWENLDELPLPDRALYFDRYRFMADFPWKKFTTGRGCFHHCSYCYQPAYRNMCRGLGRYIRRKSPGRVIAEVAAVAERWRLANAHFSDDLFITDPHWLEEFAAEYARRVNIPFTVNSSAEFVTPQSARLLAAAGCRAVAIGIETADENLRRRILNKTISNETIVRAAQLIRQHGMTLVTFNMVASPGETVENVLQTMRFNAQLGAAYARVSICFPIPKTAMAEQAMAEGICLDGYSGDIYALPDIAAGNPAVNFKTALADERRFINLYHFFTIGASHPRLIPFLARLSELPPNPLFALADFNRMLKEKKVFRFSLWEGIKYWRHVGSPDKRTSNFVSLV